jgi:hypothetical protein
MSNLMDEQHAPVRRQTQKRQSRTPKDPSQNHRRYEEDGPVYVHVNPADLPDLRLLVESDRICEFEKRGHGSALSDWKSQF